MSVEWRQDSVKAIQEKKGREARERAMDAQIQAVVRAFASSADSLTDIQALEMPDLFPEWEELLEAGERLRENTVLRDGGKLYRVVQPGGVIPQEHQPPHGEGMLSVYRPVEQGHAGTEEDPIPWVYGMDCRAGQYFSWEGRLYRVAAGGDMVPCVWPPDTAGLWQWELVEQEG